MKTTCRNILSIRYVFQIIALLLCVILIPSVAHAEEAKGMTLRLGTDLRLAIKHNGELYPVGSMQSLIYGLPIPGIKRFALIEGGILALAQSKKPYADFLPGFGFGLRVYPFGKNASFFARENYGTLLFSNGTIIYEAGADADVPLCKNDTLTQYLTVGGNYFYRRHGQIADYIPEDTYTNPLSGFALRLGLMVRYF